jgi:hypothetical protein
MYNVQFALWNLRKNMNIKRTIDKVEQNILSASSSESQLADSKKCQEYFRRLPKYRKEKLLKNVLKPLDAIKSNYTGSVPSSLIPPTVTLMPEYYLFLLNSYVKGSFEAKSWPTDERNGLKNEDTVPAWCSSVMLASTVLGEGKDAEAERFLRHFIKQSPSQLARQDPLVFPFVFTSILFFAENRPDIAQWLLRAIHSVSETLPWTGSSHPLRLLIQLLLQLGPENIILHASKILLTYITIIHETLGAAYPIVQDMLSDTISRLLSYHLLDAEEVVDLGRRMVLAAELQRHNRCKDHLNLKMYLADAQLQTGNYHEARTTTIDIMTALEAGIGGMRMMPSLHMLVSRIDEVEGRQEDAIESALRAIVASIKIFGGWSDWTVKSLDFYRRMLERAKKTEEARRVSQDCDLAIEELISKLEMQTVSDNIRTGAVIGQ